MTDLAELLDETEAFVRRYVVVTSHQAVAVTLWVAHTHAIAAADITPYLAVTSPERRAGKSRLLEVLGCLVRAPISTTSISPSALFRAVDRETRSVLFDEVDTVFGRREGNEDLRALLNAGFARGGQVHRAERQGEKFVERAFNVFCPKALAAIGSLPETISDRSISIRMERKTAAESVERFRWRLVRAESARLHNELADWAAEAQDVLAQAWPALPDDLDDRAQDAWEPLLAISDLARHGWDGRARSAALALAEDKASEETTGVLLLAHVRDAFDGRERLSTAELLGDLVDREDGPWGKWWGDAVEAGRTKGPASRLAKMFKRFRIEPTKFRVGEAILRGYERDGFADAWSRYLDGSLSTPPEQRHNATRHEKVAPDQHVPLWRSPEHKGERGVAIDPSDGPVGRDSCPECGSLWVFGHGEDCSQRGTA